MDSVTNTLVRDRLTQPDCQQGFLVDGYPRTLQQVNELDEVLARTGATLDAVIELVVDHDVLIHRLTQRAHSQGRTDDTAEIIRRRQELYDEQTAPLTNHYSERGLLHMVDGDGQIEHVTTRVTNVLAQASTKAPS